MKKMFKVLAACAVLAALAACSEPAGTESTVDPIEAYGSDTLQVFNWGEYIGESVIENFENEFNVKVSYTLFGSNEEMYQKLMGGSEYDIIIPSDYTTERLIKEGLVQELDLTLIPNMENLIENVKTAPFDPDNTYSVPYFWGNVGIVYDTTVIDPADVETEGYSVFLNEKYAGEDVVVYDSERDAFMMAFKALGYSMNTEDPAEIEEAYQWLLKVDEVMTPAYVQDEVIDGIITGQYVMANVYSGDAAYMLYENENLAFFAPNEGTNTWIDSMVIPANAPAPKLAHEFMNYTLSYEAALDGSNTVGYSSVNEQVFNELSGEGGDYFENEAYTPRTGYELDEYFVYNETLKKELADLWIRVKNQ